MGQFGLAGNRAKRGVATSFEALQEMAQKDTRGDDDDMGALQELLAGAFDKNPDMMKAFENMGEDVMQMMQEMAKMSPGELQSQMEQAMKEMRLRIEKELRWPAMVPEHGATWPA